MKMKKLSVKALMSLILSAILFCMPIGAFFANRANTVEVHAEDTAEQKTESAAEESSAESTASGNDNKDSSGSGENHTEQSTENTTENSTEGTTEETQPSAKCTCKEKCSQYAVDEDCEVCAKDYKECAYINPSVKITINTPDDLDLLLQLAFGITTVKPGFQSQLVQQPFIKPPWCQL